jgi:hypothetical protein
MTPEQQEHGLQIIQDLGHALDEAAAAITRLDTTGEHAGEVAGYRDLLERMRQTVEHGEAYEQR